MVWFFRTTYNKTRPKWNLIQKMLSSNLILTKDSCGHDRSSYKWLWESRMRFFLFGIRQFKLSVLTIQSWMFKLKLWIKLRQILKVKNWKSMQNLLSIKLLGVCWEGINVCTLLKQLQIQFGSLLCIHHFFLGTKGILLNPQSILLSSESFFFVGKDIKS